MSAFRPFSAADAADTAASALSQAAGERIALTDIQDLGGEERRNVVLRAVAVAAGGAAGPVIVKATRQAGYDAGREDAYEKSGLMKEWAAASLLAERAGAAPWHPALLAADLGRGVLVFEDRGAALGSLVRPLLHGSAAAAEHALAAYAVALGKLHAATVGCGARHAAMIRVTLPAAKLPRRAEGWVDRVPRKIAARLGGDLPLDELASVEKRLQDPGRWLALVHGDACPDNVLLAPDGAAVLIDLEFAGPGHALLDAAYWRMGFPTCWCAGTVPETTAQRLDAAYLEAVGVAVDEQDFRRETAFVAVVCLLGALSWQLAPALEADESWGIATRRARILHYFDAALTMSAAADILPGTRGLAEAWLRDLKHRWPSSEPLAPYPAFRAVPPGDAR